MQFRAEVSPTGTTTRTSIAPMRGESWIGTSAENRKGAGVAAGDSIEAIVELDTVPREVEVPADLAEALETVPEAKAYFESLSYSNKRRHVESIQGAKAAETRQRRIDKAVVQFREVKK